MALGRLHAANGGGKVIAVQGIPVEVHFTPPPAELLDGAAVMVIDVLRATTVQATLLDGGAEAMYPVADWGAAESLRRELPGAKLIGERGALPPPEADFGNSPTEFAAMDVRGWTVVHVTSNGTGALERAAGASFAVSACLRNLKAAAEAIFAHAQAAGGGIAIVCAGDNGGTTPSLEDGFAAGRALVALELARIGQRFDYEYRGGAELVSRFHAARAPEEWWNSDPPEQRVIRAAEQVLRASPHGKRLFDLGFGDDLRFAAQVDAIATVPLLGRDGAGRPVLRRLEPPPNP